MRLVSLALAVLGLLSAACSQGGKGTVDGISVARPEIPSVSETHELVGKVELHTQPCLPWASCAFEGISFGVRFENGVLRPWVKGERSLSELPVTFEGEPCEECDPEQYGWWFDAFLRELNPADEQERQAVLDGATRFLNEELERIIPSSDRPIWEGYLVGFTPTGDSVEGLAKLELDLEARNGDLNFTRLWSRNSRDTWSDGTLSYRVTIERDGFVRTGGDEGTVRGTFYGPRHRGMGGIVQRDDLEAAFGGRR